jgi:hypothetical protein
MDTSHSYSIFLTFTDFTDILFYEYFRHIYLWKLQIIPKRLETTDNSKKIDII